jgi:hypothetical protein
LDSLSGTQGSNGSPSNSPIRLGGLPYQYNTAIHLQLHEPTSQQHGIQLPSHVVALFCCFMLHGFRHLSRWFLPSTQTSWYRYQICKHAGSTPPPNAIYIKAIVKEVSSVVMPEAAALALAASTATNLGFMQVSFLTDSS